MGKLASVEICVFGRFRVCVGGIDRTADTTPGQRAILAILAIVDAPIAKDELRRAAGLSTRSIDPALSRAAARLSVPRLHQSRVPRAGFVSLATDVSTDVRELASVAESVNQRGTPVELVVEAAMSTDTVFGGRLGEGVMFADTGVAAFDDALRAIGNTKRRLRERAARMVLDSGSSDSGAAPWLRWAREHGDSNELWFAAVLSSYEQGDEAGAGAVFQEWSRSTDAGEAGSGGLAHAARRLLNGDETIDNARRAIRYGSRIASVSAGAGTDIAGLLGRAFQKSTAGDWNGATADLQRALDMSDGLSDRRAQADTLLAMARLTWHPGAFEPTLSERLEQLRALLDDEDDPGGSARAELAACLAGGLYQDGSVDVDVAEPLARGALEAVSFIEDRLCAAEVISRARKGLIDVDPPTIQLERSRRIVALAGSTPYHRSMGLLASVVDLLHLDRVDEARAVTEEYAHLAHTAASDLLGFHLANQRAMWALYDMDLDAADRWISRAEELAAGFGGRVVKEVTGGQRLWLAVEADDLDTLRAVSELLIPTGRGPTPPTIWSQMGALALAVVGEHDAAIDLLDRIARASRDFETVPRGPMRVGVLSLAACTVGELVAAGYSVELLGKAVGSSLDAMPANGALIGWPTVYLGPISALVEIADPDSRSERADRGRPASRYTQRLLQRCTV